MTAKPDILVREDYLTSEECADIIKLYNATPRMDFSEGIWSGRAKWLQYPPALEQKLKEDEPRLAGEFFGKNFVQDNLHVMVWNEGHEMLPHDDIGDHYPHRHFASIIYLNDDYTGGDLYLPDHGITIKPKKGLWVTFEGGKVRHGVTKIIHGTRYTAICWFTVV